jgi:hypothetical protein
MESPRNTTLGFPFGWALRKTSRGIVSGFRRLVEDGSVVTADKRQRSSSGSRVGGVERGVRRLEAEIFRGERCSGSHFSTSENREESMG